MLTKSQLFSGLPHCLDETHLDELGRKYAGKVRDVYLQDGRRMLVTTDRVSAFDHILGLIPYKGQVLNQLSLWWFEQTADLAANHVISSPDPNVTIAREAQPIPIEIVVRGYITGVTKTSLWYLYEKGERRPYGIELPDGLQKYDRLPAPIITPTTKAAQGEHDQRLTEAAILARHIVSPDLWAKIKETAVTVFQRGQALAAAAGLLLVDTKYEMGLIDGRLALIDEVHTPDSSRFWVADSWGAGREPENFDKEFLRKWYAGLGYRGDGTPPAMPDEFRVAVAERYIAVYEKLTGREFEPAALPAAPRIRQNLRGL